MSSAARRKNRRRCEKQGFRRELGRTPAPRVRERREAAALDEALKVDGAAVPHAFAGHGEPDGQRQPQGAAGSGRWPRPEAARREEATGPPGGRLEESTAPAGVERLVRLAEDLGLSEIDVDELVYDMVHRGASSAYNNGAYPDLGDLEAFDAVHDDADEEASRINNGGLDTQLGALAKAFGIETTERLMREITQ